MEQIDITKIPLDELEAVGGYSVQFGNPNEDGLCLVWKKTHATFSVDAGDIEDDAFRIEWSKSRVPKRGEYWGFASENLILAVINRRTFVVAWPAGMVEVVEESALSTWEFKRKATPKEMAKFDGPADGGNEE